MTKYSIMKQGQKLGHEQVKCFNSADAMHKFLNKQYDNRWRVSKYPFKKSGTYFSQYCGRNGLRYISTKELIC